jgi:uncharacterized membrane protein YfhO
MLLGFEEQSTNTNEEMKSSLNETLNLLYLFYQKYNMWQTYREKLKFDITRKSD